MKHKYEHDNINGQLVPPLVISDDYVLTGIHPGTVHVEAGTLRIQGTLQGTLDVQSNANAIVIGKQQGTVAIAPNATVIVEGELQGTACVDRGATLVVEPSGKLAGTLSNDGLIILRGVFGGAQSGAGELRLEGGGYIKQPVLRNGISYYEW